MKCSRCIAIIITPSLAAGRLEQLNLNTQAQSVCPWGCPTALSCINKLAVVAGFPKLLLSLVGLSLQLLWMLGAVSV
jgi:hypothetical protein